MRIQTSAALVTLACLASTASAATVVAPFEIDTESAGFVERNYFQFGFTDEHDEWQSLVGAHVTESRLTVHFRPGPLGEAGVDGSAGPSMFDPARLKLSMVVPVENDERKTYFALAGVDLVETTPGQWDAEIVTTAFNGLIRGGRFSLDVAAFDERGNACEISGAFVGGSGFFYTVDAPNLPEPATLGSVALASMMLRRGRRKIAW